MKSFFTVTDGERSERNDMDGYTRGKNQTSWS